MRTRPKHEGSESSMKTAAVVTSLCLRACALHFCSLTSDVTQAGSLRQKLSKQLKQQQLTKQLLLAFFLLGFFKGVRPKFTALYWLRHVEQVEKLLFWRLGNVEDKKNLINNWSFV